MHAAAVNTAIKQALKPRYLRIIIQPNDPVVAPGGQELEKPIRIPTTLCAGKRYP
jgi:hypothetical protein